MFCHLIDNLRPIRNVPLSAVAAIGYYMNTYLLYINMVLFPCLKSLCSALLLTEQHFFDLTFLGIHLSDFMVAGLQTYILVNIA